MKLIVRADDFGFTKTYNDGLLKAVEHGIVTTVDLMLDTPGFEDAATRIKNYPWISVGWHTHFYWKPTLSPDKIPSLINPSTGRFKQGLPAQPDIDYDQAVAECRAQIEKCIRIMGRAPDTTDMNGESVFDRARMQVCDEYGILYHFAEKHIKEAHIVSDTGKVLQEIKISHPSPRFAPLDIYFPADLNSLRYVHQDSAAAFLQYDPVEYYITDPDHMAEHKVAVQPWHPGYTDEFVTSIYDNPLLNAARSKDINALCSDRLKNWVKEHHIELVNYRDAIFGTREYQNHLKVTQSDLAL